MNNDSLAARVATARALVEGCVRDGAADLSAADQANLQETLEFLKEVSSALSGGDVSHHAAENDAETALADSVSRDQESKVTESSDADPDTDQMENDGSGSEPVTSDGSNADKPGEGILERHDEAGVIFEDNDPTNENAWIAASPDSIESLQNRR